MSQNEIIEWLDSEAPDLQTGIALYHLHGRNRHLKQRFKCRNPGKWIEVRLRYQLGKIVGRNHMGSRKVVTPDVTPVVAMEDPKVQPPRPEVEESPETIGHGGVDQLAQQKRAMFAQRAKLSNSLRDFALEDNDGRKAVVLQIKELTRQMNLIRLTQIGNAPEVEPAYQTKLKELPNHIAGLIQERNNLRARITKARKQFNKCEPNTEGWMKYKTKLEVLEKRLEEVEGRLK